MRTAYLDANFVIDVIDPASPRHLEANTQFSAARDMRFAGSRLLETECIVRPMRLGRAEVIDRFYGVYLVLTDLAFTDQVFITAAQLRAQHGLKTPDALHLGCALVHGCDEFWTHDERLARLNGQLALTVVT